MTAENTAPVPPEADITEAEIDAAIASLLEPEEERIPVILAVPNGMVVNGQPQLIPTVYPVTTTTLMEAQALLSNGSKLNVPDVMQRVSAALTSVIGDADVAQQAAAHLTELGLVK